MPPVVHALTGFGSSPVPMATATDRPVTFVRLSVNVILWTRVRREYRNARLPECMDSAVMSQDRARVDLVVNREFRNAFMCLVFMVSRVWLVMSVEVVSPVSQGFRSVRYDLKNTSRKTWSVQCRLCLGGIICRIVFVFQLCFHRPRRYNEPCSAGFSCAPGLSCQPGDQRCFHHPRRENERCSAGYACADGLVCRLCDKPYATCQLSRVPALTDQVWGYLWRIVFSLYYTNTIITVLLVTLSLDIIKSNFCYTVEPHPRDQKKCPLTGEVSAYGRLKM